MSLSAGAGSIADRGDRGSGDWLARHPECWMLALSAAAWVTLVWIGATEPAFLSQLCVSHATGLIDRYLAGLAAASSQLAADLTGWMVMAAAMMLPLVLLPARHVAFRSYVERRQRALAAFVAGYLATWLPAGFAVIAAVVVADALGQNGPWLAATVLVVAAVWQLTPFKEAALQRCHRNAPLSPLGWRADLDAMKFGASIGGDCIASCGLLMAAPLFTSHGIWVMIGVQAVAFAERYAREPAFKSSAVVLLACAVVLLAV